MRRRAAKLAIALALTLLVAGSAFAEMVYNRGNTSEPESLDPHKTSTVSEAHILRDLFEGLVMPDARGDLIPGAAESWTVSDDGTVYTFKLRDGAVWSNGDPVTADDFVYAFGRLEDPATGAEYASMLYVIKNAEAINSGKAKPEEIGARAIDPQDARDHAQRADAVFPRDAGASGGLSGASGHRGRSSARHGRSPAISSRTAPSRSPNGCRTTTSRSSRTRSSMMRPA